MANEAVVAIVPAAGESRRMGTLKPLLPYGSESVIQSVVRSLKACPVSEVIVVLGHRSEEIAEVLAESDVKLVVNHNYQAGMLSSLQCGLRTAPESAAWFLIALGDQPSLDPKVVRLLLAAGMEGSASILVPSFHGKRGHPLLLQAKHRTEVLALDPNLGLRELLRRHPDAVQHVSVLDEAVLHDMDTPEDYQRELRRMGNRAATPASN